MRIDSSTTYLSALTRPAVQAVVEPASSDSQQTPAAVGGPATPPSPSSSMLSASTFSAILDIVATSASTTGNQPTSTPSAHVVTANPTQNSTMNYMAGFDYHTSASFTQSDADTFHAVTGYTMLFNSGGASVIVDDSGNSPPASAGGALGDLSCEIMAQRQAGFLTGDLTQAKFDDFAKAAAGSALEFPKSWADAAKAFFASQDADNKSSAPTSKASDQVAA